jgi:hypothetical protein
MPTLFTLSLKAPVGQTTRERTPGAPAAACQFSPLRDVVYSVIAMPMGATPEGAVVDARSEKLGFSDIL